MNYYYDVLLNFQDNFYMFYEWDETDNIEYIKKIPLYNVDSNTFNNFLENEIIINDNFLSEIENKTKLKQNKFIKYAAVFSDGKNSVALEFNSDGKVINKSSVLLEDELNIIEFIFNVNKSKIDYQVVGSLKKEKESRQSLLIKKIIKLEINNMYNSKNVSKLKYIYLEWFNEILNNIDEMYNNMLHKINEELTDREYHIYEIIKLSYNNV